MNSKVFIATLLLFAMLAPLARAQDRSALAIEFQGETIGTIEGLSLEPTSDDPSTLLVRLTARFPLFTETLDRVLGEEGNFGSCSRRLYWAGSTSIDQYGASLKLSSRIRYEQWVCGVPFVGDQRIFRDTKTVDWRLFVEPDRLDNLQISAQVENVRNLQNDLERALGLRVRENIRIPLPAYCGRCECSQVTTALRPTVEAARFSQEGGDVRVTVTFSVASDLTDALACL